MDAGAIQFAYEDGFPQISNGEYYREIPQSEDSYRMAEMLLCAGPELVTMTNAECTEHCIEKALEAIDYLREEGGGDDSEQ